MFSILIHKMMKNKGMVICLLIGLIISVAMVCSVCRTLNTRKCL